MGRLVGVRGVRLRMGLGNENRAWRDEVDEVDGGRGEGVTEAPAL